jgi:hypothetical protein
MPSPRHLKVILLSALLGLLPTLNSLAAEPPKTFDNTYKAKLYGFKVTVTNRLTKSADNRYQLMFKADSMLGSITETSELLWNPAQQTVMPEHYIYARRSIGKDRHAELKFDWAKKSVTNNVAKTTWKMDIAQRVQDKLSYQLQLQQDLLNGKESFDYQIADGGHLKEYRFTKVAEELLDTPLGKVATVKIKRSRENDNRITYAWLAPKWNYMLVRLQQEEDGDAYTIYITQANLNGKPVTKF